MSRRNPFWTPDLAALQISLSSWRNPDGNIVVRQSASDLDGFYFGELTAFEVTDFITVELVAGTEYIFLVNSNDYTPRVSLFDNQGYLLDYTDGDDIGLPDPLRTDSIVGFVAGYTGRHYLGVTWEYVSSAQGFYGLGIEIFNRTTANPPPPPPPPPPLALPVLSIAGAPSLNEGNAGTTNFVVTVSRSGDASGTSTVAWAVAGTGSNPASSADFVGGTLPTGTVVFSPGQTTAAITVPVRGDTEVEPTEGFRVTLTGPTGATLGTSAQTATIINDDTAPAPTPPAASRDVGRQMLLNGQVTNPAPADGSFGLQWTLSAGTGNDVVVGTSGNDLINGLAGSDALDAGTGNDIVDGGLGSNFLSGGAGSDRFFVDGRGANGANGSVVWSTITDFDRASGEQVTVWGWQDGVSRVVQVVRGGAQGFEGATWHFDLTGDGVIDASVTLSGLVESDVRLTPGTVGGSGYMLLG